MGKSAHSIAAVVVAAGQGERVGGPVPKQYLPLDGRPLIHWSLSRLATHPAIHPVLAVIHPDFAALHEESVAGLDLPPAVHGGATRQESVLNGLEALRVHAPDLVLVHDAARPFVSEHLLDEIVRTLRERRCGVIPVTGITDTVKYRSGNEVTGTADRDRLVCAQTPQGFPYAGILAAHQQAYGRTFTDDSAVAEAAGMTVVTVNGDRANIKITHAEDFSVPSDQTEISTGTGYDAHALVAGDHVMLCGVRIDHDRTLEGNTDGDVGLHALVDAVLGALGCGDLGRHFPVGDATWSGRPSGDLVRVARDLMTERRATLLHADITLMCQKPRLAPRQEEMRHAVAGLLGVGESRVNIKVTSTDGLGFLGRCEGIAAAATVTIRRPLP
ncbi:MAG: 2-C-methyl-D-erythritol 4-phosphate cytidylyltransferase [bacterium]|nr:2-C-methyl-D-erythritol 4-phosphate cytidylyltransferase [bacterium]